MTGASFIAVNNELHHKHRQGRQNEISLEINGCWEKNQGLVKESGRERMFPVPLFLLETQRFDRIKQRGFSRRVKSNKILR